MMKQLQFYKYATWALLLLNISMVAFFFLTAPPPPQRGKMGIKAAPKVLNLDEQQAESFTQFAQ